jgi:hypothetical protein
MPTSERWVSPALDRAVVADGALEAAGLGTWCVRGGWGRASGGERTRAFEAVYRALSGGEM